MPIRFLCAFLLGALLGGCAKGNCEFNSECQRGVCLSGECVIECQRDIDCPDGRACDNGACRVRDGGAPDSSTEDAPPVDSSMDSAIDSSIDSAADTKVDPDTSVTPTDTSTPVDTDPPPTDTSTGGTKAYLTACTSDDECVSGVCGTDSPRFCTQACAVDGECADGQICAAGRCVLDDIGTTGCSVSTSAPCKQACFGSPTVASARHCTHSCSTGADCPSGYACSEVEAGKPKVCVDIERGCTTADQCPSSLGFCGAGGLGCTAKCNTAADCPVRLVGLPAYTCELRSGVKVCVPPSDVRGSDSLGTSCPATGLNACRSGACDDGVSPPMCNQRCTVRGGCGKGWGCFPLEDAGSTLLVCTAVTGTKWLGDTCTRGRDCVTGICQSPGYCTRLCVDGLCPTGMSCVAVPLTATDGTPIKLCSK